MNANAKSRRWLAGLCLATAIAMLVAGETVLKPRLTGSIFVVYWLVCFGLTGLAAIVALRDVARVRAENREQQRTLIESALREIEQKQRSRSSQPPSSAP